jgi:hypothetical protein
MESRTGKLVGSLIKAVKEGAGQDRNGPWLRQRNEALARSVVECSSKMTEKSEVIISHILEFKMYC